MWAADARLGEGQPAVVRRVVDSVMFWRPVERRRLLAALDIPVLEDRVPPEPACSAAGWYVDIHTPGYLRWWDGAAWRQHWTPS